MSFLIEQTHIVVTLKIIMRRMDPISTLLIEIYRNFKPTLRLTTLYTKLGTFEEQSYLACPYV